MVPKTLQPLPIDALRANAPLPGAIFDADGQTLFRAGHVLQDVELLLLRKQAAGDLFIGDDWVQPTDTDAPPASDLDWEAPPPHRADLIPIHVDRLSPGMKLTASLFDADGVLLLATPNVVTQRFMRLLQQHCTRYVFVRGDSSAGVNAAMRLETQSARAPKALDELQLWAKARELLTEHLEASNLVMNVCQTALGGGQPDTKSAQSMVERFYGHCAQDGDLLLAIVSLQQSENEYLFDHCVNVSMIGMSLAVRLGLSEHLVQEIGLAGLLQDIGMLWIPDEVRLATRELTRRERKLVSQHPAFTAQCLCEMGGVAQSIPALVLQVHERLDGSGYPRGLSGSQIALPARVLAIADVFCAMTCPRPHRHSLIPHIALRNLLKSAHAGQFDRNVLRVFLDMQSAFGVGSLVELNDGRQVRIVRAIPHAHTRPCVVTIEKHTGKKPEVINLTRTQQLHIARAVAEEKKLQKAAAQSKRG